ncbi:hypothetical protein TMEC54S_00114 [Thauera mechernichensis]
MLSLRDAASKDLNAACAEFGTDQRFAKFVTELTMSQIQKICSTERVLFRPAIDIETLAALTKIPQESSRAYATIAGA